MILARCQSARPASRNAQDQRPSRPVVVTTNGVVPVGEHAKAEDVARLVPNWTDRATYIRLRARIHFDCAAHLAAEDVGWRTGEESHGGAGAEDAAVRA